MHKFLFTHGVVYLFVTVASMVATPARSDQAFLKSGDRISGKLVRFEENLLVFQTYVAGTARLLRKDLLAIASAATVTAVFRLRSGLRFPVIWGLATSLTWDLDYESEPQPGRRSTDNTLRVSIGYDW